MARIEEGHLRRQPRRIVLRPPKEPKDPYPDTHPAFRDCRRTGQAVRSGGGAIVWSPRRSPEECCADVPDLDKSVTVPVGRCGLLDRACAFR
jgi:hypothetical protein